LRDDLLAAGHLPARAGSGVATMRIASALVFLAIELATYQSSVFAADFLYTEDNGIVFTEKEMDASLKREEELPDNEWWNKPLTRLDYALMRIDGELHSHISNQIRLNIPGYFEASKLDVDNIWSVDGDARYMETLGRVILRVGASGIGRPKKPMKQFCEQMIEDVKLSYPLDLGFSWFWQNNALGILEHDVSRPDDHNKYTGVAEKLAGSTAIRASVTTSYRDRGKDQLFWVGCMQQSAGPIIFSKLGAAAHEDGAKK
jgi:hypothetical protein